MFSIFLIFFDIIVEKKSEDKRAAPPRLALLERL